MPFASMALQPRVDHWGRVQKNNPNVAGRAAENFLSPGYVGEGKATLLDKEIDREFTSKQVKTQLYQAQRLHILMLTKSALI